MQPFRGHKRRIKQIRDGGQISARRRKRVRLFCLFAHGFLLCRRAVSPYHCRRESGIRTFGERISRRSARTTASSNLLVSEIPHRPQPQLRTSSSSRLRIRKKSSQPKRPSRWPAARRWTAPAAHGKRITVIYSSYSFAPPVIWLGVRRSRNRGSIGLPAFGEQFERLVDFLAGRICHGYNRGAKFALQVARRPSQHIR